jgi:hypothetical protein
MAAGNSGTQYWTLATKVALSICHIAVTAAALAAAAATTAAGYLK